MSLSVKLLCVIGACGALVVPGVAQGDPPFLTSAAGTCDPALGSSHWSAPPAATGGYAVVDARVTVDGGPGELALPGSDVKWSGAQAQWTMANNAPYGSGATASGTVSCLNADAPFHYKIEWFELPDLHTPVSFTGEFAPGSESTFGFRAPEDAEYAGELDAAPGFSYWSWSSGGGLLVTIPGAFVEREPWPLSYMRLVRASAQMPYTMHIAEVTPFIWLLKGPPAFLRGDPISLSYRTDAPGHVVVTVTSTNGFTRTLYEGRVDGGSGLTWDGRDADGAPAPDGFYKIRIAATNLAGTSDRVAYTTIDTTPPEVVFDPPLTYHGSLGVRLNDATSGIASAQLTLDGVTSPLKWFPPQTAPLEAGTHTARVVATDRAGYSVDRSVTFTVPGPVRRPAYQSCSRTGAKRAVRGSAPLVDRLQRLSGRRSADVFSAYSLAATICRDLTGDGQPDLALLLKAHGHGPTPVVIFRRSGADLSQTYLSTRARVRALIAKQGSLVEKRTTIVKGHRRAQSLTLSWNGTRFVLAAPPRVS